MTETLSTAEGERDTPDVLPFAVVWAAHGALLERATALARSRGLAARTEETYLHWILRFIGFMGNQDPVGLGAAEIRAFLKHLAEVRKVSASTQHLAFNGLRFLYAEVLGREDLDFATLAPPRRPKREPVVLTRDEVAALLAQVPPQHWLMASLLYGAGLRLMECAQLRVLDVDFGAAELTVRDTKGGTDRVVPLPEALAVALRTQLGAVRELHLADQRQGLGEVWLPATLARRMPFGARDWRWQFVFPSRRLTPDADGVLRRQHMNENGLQKAVNMAARAAGIDKRVGTQTLRNSFAAHLLQAGQDIRAVQVTLGHSATGTTKVYQDALLRGALAVRSPLDA